MQKASFYQMEHWQYVANQLQSSISELGTEKILQELAKPNGLKVSTA